MKASKAKLMKFSTDPPSESPLSSKGESKPTKSELQQSNLQSENTQTIKCVFKFIKNYYKINIEHHLKNNTKSTLNIHSINSEHPKVDVYVILSGHFMEQNILLKQGDGAMDRR